MTAAHSQGAADLDTALLLFTVPLADGVIAEVGTATGGNVAVVVTVHGANATGVEVTPDAAEDLIAALRMSIDLGAHRVPGAAGGARRAT